MLGLPEKNVVKNMKECETFTLTETVTRSKVKSVTCDFCGKQFGKEEAKNGWYNSIEIRTTYGSRHDGFRFSGEVCDDCIDKHFAGKLTKEVIGYL
jgi:hypothetical protein